MDLKQYETHVSIKQILNMLKTIPKILNLIKKVDKTNFYLIILLSLFSGLCPIITLLTSQKLLNLIETKNMKIILGALIAYILANLLSNCIGSLLEYLDGRFQRLTNFKLNYLIMDKCTRLSLRHFEDSDIYDKLQRVQNETSYKPYSIFLSIIVIMTSLITLVSSVIIIVNWKPWVLAILVLIPLLSSLSFFKIAQREFNVLWSRASNNRKSWYLTYLLTRDNAFKEIKLYNLGNYLLKKYKDMNKVFVKEDVCLLKKRTTFTFFFEIVEQICIDIILIIVIYSATIGEILIGNVVGLINALNLVANNSKKILNTIYSLYQDNLYIEQLFDFLSIKEDLDESEQNLTKKNSISEIEKIQVKNLNFSYPSSNVEVLKNINFEINKGETVAIVGKNGSGKSTLAKLLLSLYNVDDNTILFNDDCVNTYNILNLRKNIAALFQDFAKYELTFRENVAFGDIDSINDDKKIKKVIKDMDINYINDVDAQLGVWFNNGMELSGGQWQKIAIARTLFRDASLYILDEPSSALDPIAEKKLIDTFIKMVENKIGIFISHRLSTAKLADKIIVMDKGSIVGIGTHDELFENNKVYKEMYEIETLRCEIVN
ncbi:ABC transporter ATP-binding protein [Romboutsia sedimentorum]|uniref:ABC transporter ATP-binding protein n=1 Tax=Romboutsia sedimentorum TaxID=1368474 RepID=A0ABT7EC03_9FIRM|nr:ABC transporter ATP-binding protein [Romboutsia sedimentorum]MDK2564232.1 ABC transporter ATP-binding protein [Romboutsia sedimentorum]